MCTFDRLNASCVLVVTGLFTTALGCFGQVMELHSSSMGVISGGDASRETLAIGTTGDEAPQAITLRDAIARAQKIYSQYLTTVTDSQVAREDFRQARNAMLPSVGYTQQYFGTQGNGKTPNGRYVTQDGVHVYRLWPGVHQELPAGFSRAVGHAPNFLIGVSRRAYATGVASIANLLRGS